MLRRIDILIANATRPMLRPGAPSAADDPVLSQWIADACARAGEAGEGKFRRLRKWMASIHDLQEIRERLPEAARILEDGGEQELHRQMVLAAGLRGRLDTALRAESKSSVISSQFSVLNTDNRQLTTDNCVRQANAGLFGSLPFTQAIAALAERLGLTKDKFLELDAAARSRAFTMARVGDESILQSIHDEISQAITDGETYASFEKRMGDVQDRTGWTGSEPWHYRLVYDTNAGMAYSSGRYQQGVESGLAAWRYLPSISDQPRPEHQPYYNQLYRAAPGTPMPPIDFNCACGWEWTFPEELEGVNVADLPEFRPPVPESGFVWSASDYLPAKQSSRKLPVISGQLSVRGADGMRSGTENRELRTDNFLVPCQAVDVGAAPSEVLLLPWGEVESDKGNFVVDEESSEAMKAAFAAHGTDIPIDYEHTTLGGEFASPDGSAPAMGWIKDLGIFPGIGVFGRVEWTPRGASMLANREYRYLSPVVAVRKSDRKAMELHSAALTNKPAITNMPAIVNKASDAAALDWQQDYLREEVPMRELALKAKQIATAADLSAEQKLPKIIALIEGAPEPQANKAPDFGPAIAAAAAELGEDGKPIAEAVGKGDVEAASKGLVLAVNRAKNPPGKVDAAEYQRIKERQDKLEAELADRDCEALIQANSTKLPPAKVEWFKTMFRKDPEFAKQWITEAPELIANKSTTADATKGACAPDRVTLINSARGKFREEAQTKKVLCSERAWVNQALREAGQQPVSDEETKALAIAIA